MSCPICGHSGGENVLKYSTYPLFVKPVPADMLTDVPLRPLVIRLCGCCGQVFQEDPVDQADLALIYEKIYESYHSPVSGGIGSGLAAKFLAFLERNGHLDGQDVLEIGCFDGYLLSLLRDRHGCRVAGCDPSHGARIAQSIGIYVRQEYFSPALFGDRFSLVILRGVLEHIADPVEFLRMAGRVMAPGGRMAIEVPDLLSTLHDGVIGDFFHEHITYFTDQTLTQCLDRAGFTPVAKESNGGYLRVVAGQRRNGASSPVPCPGETEVARIRPLFCSYRELGNRMVREVKAIAEGLAGDDVYIYGGGGHTIGLLSRVGNLVPVKGVIDGDPAKAGKFIPGFGIPVFPKEMLKSLEPARTVIIVSSRVFQQEIVRELAPCLARGMRVLVLYRNVEYVASPTHHPTPQEDGNDAG